MNIFKEIKATIFIVLMFLTNANFAQNREELECYNFLDASVKKCNGTLVSQKNFHQLSASFSSKGYAALTDEKTHSDEDVNIHKTIKIKWEHLTNVNITKMTFQYSCICVQFADGFSPISFWSRNTGFNKESIIDPIEVDAINWPYDNYYQNKSRGGFSFVVKTEDASNCVEMIYKLFELSKKKNTNSLPKKLEKHEEWNGGYLSTWYTDEKGIKQGNYELKNSEGKLISYGEYKDNVKVGNWVEYENPKTYKQVKNECICGGYH